MTFVLWLKLNVHSAHTLRTSLQTFGTCALWTVKWTWGQQGGARPKSARARGLWVAVGRGGAIAELFGLGSSRLGTAPLWGGQGRPRGDCWGCGSGHFLRKYIHQAEDAPGQGRFQPLPALSSVTLDGHLRWPDVPCQPREQVGTASSRKEFGISPLQVNP